MPMRVPNTIRLISITMAGTALCVMPRFTAVVYCAARMKKKVKPAMPNPPIITTQPSRARTCGQIASICRRKMKTRMARQLNQRSPIMVIGDISPTDRRAATVCPAHIHIAMVRVKCGLFQRRVSMDVPQHDLLVWLACHEWRPAGPDSMHPGSLEST